MPWSVLKYLDRSGLLDHLRCSKFFPLCYMEQFIDLDHRGKNFLVQSKILTTLSHASLFLLFVNIILLIILFCLETSTFNGVDSELRMVVSAPKQSHYPCIKRYRCFGLTRIRKGEGKLRFWVGYFSILIFSYSVLTKRAS